MVPQLFEGTKVRFAAFDPDKDAEVFSRWSNNPEYLRQVSEEPPRPVSPFHVKKRMETMEKEARQGFYFFVIRTKEDDRAVGYCRFEYIEWNHGNAGFELTIAMPDDRHKGYGSEALEMLLRYAFEELNLYRVGTNVPEFNTGAQDFVTKRGFQLEVQRREALYRFGRYWDVLSYGMLAKDWVVKYGSARADIGVTPARATNDNGK